MSTVVWFTGDTRLAGYGWAMSGAGLAFALWAMRRKAHNPSPARYPTIRGHRLFRRTRTLSS
ncbi:hypothetical protein OHS58_46280 [Amycolatopsis sp. NBC_00348]|uniref:hypothetical protein n=1 Tax=Amycolatopsis sp. NBC_00348 TaxID=2975956 RepID=UPI002E26448D